jgi:antitoxin MazE
MYLPMKTRLVSMGNSRGVRIPKPLIEQAGLGDEVELELRDGVIVIAAAHAPRAGWAEAIARVAGTAEPALDPEIATRFDETEWRW